MVFKTRVKHLGNPVVPVKQVNDRRSVCAVTIHANSKGLHASQYQIRIERSGDSTDGVLDETDMFG